MNFPILNSSRTSANFYACRLICSIMMVFSFTVLTRCCCHVIYFITCCTTSISSTLCWTFSIKIWDMNWTIWMKIINIRKKHVKIGWKLIYLIRVLNWWHKETWEKATVVICIDILSNKWCRFFSSVDRYSWI